MSTTFDVRLTEYRQLQSFLPDIIDLYESRDLDEEVEVFENVFSSIDEHYGPYTFDDDTVSDLVYALEELGDMKASWLGSKIARRAGLTASQQGFSTMVPIGTHMEARMSGR